MTNRSDDALLFKDEDVGGPSIPKKPDNFWKILIVDDEEGVHSVTEMALDSVQFSGKGLQFLHAYSGEEAKELMAANDDVAIILLDVVMETDDAGLLVADHVRKALKNHHTRIILRTGQPGQAPEEDVVVRYDINAYKEKTELTFRKLFSTIYTALRSYRDIMALERNRAGLEKVIQASGSILEQQSLRGFSQGVLEQLAALLYMEQDILLLEYDGVVAEKDGDGLRILAQSGAVGGESEEELHPEIRERIQEALDRKTDIERDDFYIRYVADRNGFETVLYIAGNKALADVDQHVMELYCRNAAIAFDNVRLNTRLRQTQKEIVYNLCEVAETRSKETGNHVRRVAYYSRLVAKHLGLDEQQCEEVFLAAPLHDIGKIGIPDAVLNKPGKLDAEEWEIMKTHAGIGQRILARAPQPIMQAGAIIAGYHHENWDGSGYPYGLAGEDIPIFGRIVALADVFDALASKRCYKDKWPIDDIDALIKEERGRKFEPRIVDIYLENRDQFVDILNRYQDDTDQAAVNVA